MPDEVRAAKENGGRGRLSQFVDLEPATESFRDAVIEGLSQRQKSVPSKFLYDAEGSRLFDEICAVEEYYPTRTELALLRARAGEIADLAGRDTVLVEYGSGASVKVRILLDALSEPAGYVAIDISGEHLRQAASAVAADYPDLEVSAVCADYTSDFELPSTANGDTRLGFFPGSTIGNFTPAAAVDFLRHAAATLGSGGALVIGADLKKDPDILKAAYNDAAGVTAEFNLNLLTRINRELGGTFDVEAFSHDAVWNSRMSRIEMHLRSRRTQAVEVDGTPFRFAEGETIHTENSYKFDIVQFRHMAGEAGFRPERTWTDREGLFSVHYLAVAA